LPFALTLILNSIETLCFSFASGFAHVLILFLASLFIVER